MAVNAQLGNVYHCTSTKAHHAIAQTHRNRNPTNTVQRLRASVFGFEIVSWLLYKPVELDALRIFLDVRFIGPRIFFGM